jgi:hypothetical protein
MVSTNSLHTLINNLMKEGYTMKIKNIANLPASKLNSLYLGKSIVYNSRHGAIQGKIINIAYYSNLEPIPYAEIELYLWDCRTDTKIIPLSEVVLVSKVA